jgi:hypothetical protein
MAPALLALAVLPGAPEAFVPWFTESGVEVSIAREAERIPWIRGVAELPASSEAIRRIVTDFPRYRELMAPVVAKAAVLESGPSSARIHFVWDYPFPLRDRDAIVLYAWESGEQGIFRLTWRDDARLGDPGEGVRIPRVEGETVVEPLGPDRCRVRYTYLGDLGGKFPKAAEEKAWRKEPVAYVLALRRRLAL